MFEEYYLQKVTNYWYTLYYYYLDMSHYLKTPNWRNNPSDEDRIIKASRININTFFTDVSTDWKMTPWVLRNFTEDEIFEIFSYYSSQLEKPHLWESLSSIYEHNISVIKDYKRTA